MTETMMETHGLDRRSLLQRTGLLSLGLAASGGVLSAAAGLGSRALTASALKPLVGSVLSVSTENWTGKAEVLPLRGNGNFAVKERSFQLHLLANRKLAAEGSLLTIDHDALGEHLLFFAPDRDGNRWVAVVQDLGTTVRLSRRVGAQHG